MKVSLSSPATLAFFVVGVSVPSWATECQDWQCVYLDLNGGVANSKNNQETEGFGRLGGGMHVTPSFDVGLNGVYLGNRQDSTSTTGLEGYVRSRTTVGIQAELYLDVGVTTFGDHLTLGGGFMYELTPSWDIDVGYRYYSDVTNRQGDTYNFAVGLEYTFERTRQGTPKMPPLFEQERKVEPAPAAIPTLELVMEHQSESTRTCPMPWSSRITHDSDSPVRLYLVREGDWAYKIARERCTTLTTLEQFNPFLIDRAEQEYILYPNDKLRFPVELGLSVNKLGEQ